MKRKMQSIEILKTQRLNTESEREREKSGQTAKQKNERTKKTEWKKINKDNACMEWGTGKTNERARDITAFG